MDNKNNCNNKISYMFFCLKTKVYFCICMKIFLYSSITNDDITKVIYYYIKK